MDAKTTEFILKAKKLHGDIYDYSKVVYIDAHTKVVIGCQIHGDFPQSPNGHLVKDVKNGGGRGCKKCGLVKSGLARRKNKEHFVNEAVKVHGDAYDYSKVIYVTSTDNVIIICPKEGHGEFLQKPCNHLQGKKCSKCSGCYQPNTDEFIQKAKNIHGENTYDYSLVNYVDCKTPVVIICPKDGHGPFEQAPSNHYIHGCSKCGYKRLSEYKTSTTDEFIQKAKEKHGDTYDYTNALYTRNDEEVTIGCKIHGLFPQIASVHLRGGGCSKCGGCYKRNTDEFIQEAVTLHGGIYDYSMVDYTGCKDYVTIICPKEGHGPFQQTPDSHINNIAGCSKCGYEQLSEYKTFTTDEFIQKATEKHGDRYDYTYVDYKDSQTNVTICCKVIGHGPFEQAPSSHLQGRGCSSCVWKTEGKLYDTLKSKYPTIQRQFKADWCKNKTYLPFDLCIEEDKTIIELDGGQHFIQVSNWSSPEHQFQNDIYKQKCANENGYSVIRLLQEDVLYDRYDWCKKIYHAIEEIKNSDEPKNIYLCENNEYYRYK